MKTKILTIIKSSMLIFLVSIALLVPIVSTAYAATDVQREDVLKNSPEHDGENDNLGICSADDSGGNDDTGGGDHEAGKVYLIGDSIGVGVANPLTAALGTTEGWSLQSDSVEGRSLSEGITAAGNIPDDAKHVLVILGANSTDASKEQIQQMANATKGKSTYWLGLNLTRSDLVEPSKGFNDKLKTVEGITYIENGVAPTAGDGVHHTSDGYSLLAQYIAGVMKGSSSNTTETGGSSNTTQDMTLREKVAKLVFIRAGTPDQIKAAADAKVGGIFVRNSSNANDSNLYNSIKTQATGVSLIAVDFEGGRVQAPGANITGAVPSAQAMGQMTEAEIKTLAKEMGAKLAGLGVTMDFAPVVDIGGNNSAVIGDRAFANDPDGVTAKAGAFAEGLREAGITPVLKHYPGHGSKDGDSHAGPVATEPLATLEGRDLKPYNSLTSSSKVAVMVGHLKVPEWGDTPTSLNSKAYAYLRSTVGFNGLVVTDALDMNGISASFGGESDRAVYAIAAGADMALINTPSELTPTIDKLEAAVNAGTIEVEKVNQSVSRIQASGGSSSGGGGGSCVCSAGSATGVDKSFNLGSDPMGRRVALMKALMKDLGLTAEQAAGIIGNFVQESGGAHLPPDVNQGYDTGAPPIMGNDMGYGWAQWSYDPGRKRNFVTFAVEQGYVESEKVNFNDAANYAFLKYELTNGYANALADLKKQSTASDAAFSFHKYYEGSADDAAKIQERLDSAEQALNEYNQGGGSSSGGGGASSCSGSSSIVGNVAFPLIINKSDIGNPNIFHDETTDSGSHPYTSYDIYTPKGAPVVAFLAGKVIKIDADDACGGGLQNIQIFNSEEKKTVFYTHLRSGSITVTKDQEVNPGDPLAHTPNTGEVSELDGGCSTAHLHIDAVTGEGRPACSRTKCEPSNASRFVNIGPELYKTWLPLPD